MAQPQGAAEPDPRSILDAEILQRFDVGPFLGKGSFGVVFAAVDRKSKAKVAIKVAQVAKLGKAGVEQTRGEIQVMSLMNHPKLVKLHEAIINDKSICMALDLVEGGEVLKHLITLKHYSERTACTVIRSLMQAIKYMHDEGICHRDLKPDNMLLVEKPKTPPSPEDVYNIKVADFGFATKYRGVPLVQPCGTPYYIAPEILEVGLHKTRKFYDNMVDIWSAGVITYVLLAGTVPFNGADKQKLFKAICKGEVSFSNPPAVWRNVSDLAKDFIMKLLVVDPTKRFTATQALAHRWLRVAEATPDSHLTNSQENLKEFSAREKFKGMIFGVEAAFRLTYLSRCAGLHIKPNSSIVEKLTGAAGKDRLRSLDLSGNYLGPKGLIALMAALVEQSEIEELNLTNVILEDSHCEALLNALEGLPIDLPTNSTASAAAHPNPGLPPTAPKTAVNSPAVHETTKDGGAKGSASASAPTVSSVATPAPANPFVIKPGAFAKLTRLILNQNPITHAIGRRLLSMLHKGRLKHVEVKDTQISASICKKIEKASAGMTPSRSEQNTPKATPQNTPRGTAAPSTRNPVFQQLPAGGQGVSPGAPKTLVNHPVEVPDRPSTGGVALPPINAPRAPRSAGAGNR